LSLLQKAPARRRSAHQSQNSSDDQVILILYSIIGIRNATRFNPVCNLLLDLEYLWLVPDIMPHLLVIEDLLITLRSFRLCEQVESHLRVYDLVSASLHYHKWDFVFSEGRPTLDHPPCKRADCSQPMSGFIKQGIFLAIISIVGVSAAFGGFYLWKKLQVIWQKPLQYI
jgi:hypothetical protein